MGTGDLQFGAAFPMIYRVPGYGTLNQVRKAGFDFVEFHWAGTPVDWLKRHAVRSAHKCGLEITQHQAWRLTDDGQVHNGKPGSAINQTLDMLRALPRGKYGITDHFVLDAADEIVGNAIIYADRATEAAKYWGRRVSIQTYSCRDPATKQFIVTPKDLLAVLRKYPKTKVTFDFQHMLEWYLNVDPTKGVAGLPSSKKDLVSLQLRLWEDFVQYVDEIHICDFSPEDGPWSGRNKLLGTGSGATIESVNQILKDGWTGRIVVEEQLPPFKWLHGRNVYAEQVERRKRLIGV